MTQSATTQTPFQWLQEFERRARQKAKGLPRQEEVRQIWRGIAFRLDDAFLVTALSEIR
jgi:twitching motility protein PilI